MLEIFILIGICLIGYYLGIKYYVNDIKNFYK